IDGRTLGTFFHEEFAAPLGLEFWIGLPEELEPRVAPNIPPDSGGLTMADLLGADSIVVRALLLNGALGDDLGASYNDRAHHAAELPASNGITNARSLAKFYAALIDGALSPEQI